MRLERLGITLLAMVVLGAITANRVFAANEFSETGGQWYVSGSKLSGEKAFTTTAVGTQKLETTVGGTKLDLTATGVTSSGSVIVNFTTHTATIDLTYEYTGVTVTEPKNCSVAGGKIVVGPLTGVLGMKLNIGSTQTVRFTPQSGTTVATPVLEGPGCPLAGKYKMTGTLFAEVANATGVFAINQELKFSKGIQESAGNATSLKIGEEAAFLTGAIKGKLAGEPEWGAKEE